MKALVCNGTIALALLAGVGSAEAASAWSAGIDGLTNAQRQEIWQGVGKHATKERLPAGFKAAIGEAVPGSVRLQPLPGEVSTEVPTVKPYDFAMLQNQVLIVDPASKKIIDIITR